jgi:dihydrofolate synthase/folylpolyglutamate synthase
MTDSEVAILLSQIKPLFEKMLKYHKIMPLRFFDIVTAMAFVYFAKKCVDFAVLEVGLGGRLDATNVVQPLVSVITNIGFEHTNILGETLVEIAHEKAGIIKPRSVLVTAAQNPEVYDVFRTKAETLGIPIFRVGDKTSFYKVSSSIYEQHFKIMTQENYDNISMSLLGDHQLINAITAVKAVEVLRNYNIIISKSSIIKGLRDTVWPARLEVISQNPLIVLDCAKDAEATEAVMHTVDEVFEYDRLISVVAISSDKNHEGMIYNIAQISSHFILTTHGVKRRSADPHRLAEIVKRHKRSFEIIYQAEKALKRAQKLARKKDMILIIGSVFLAGKLRKMLVK